MVKRGGKSVNPEVIRQNLEESRQIMTSLIDVLETEIEKIGDAGTISGPLYEQLLEQVKVKTDRLNEIIGVLRENGVRSARQYTDLFSRIRTLIGQIEQFQVVGGRRRAKTARKK